LNDSEIELINTIRNKGITPEEYVKIIQRSGEDAALSKIDNSAKPYQIDDLEDDELYLLDFIRKVGQDNVSDAELEQALNIAKANESLYKKTVDALREEYKTLEDESEMQKQQELAQQQEQDLQYFSEKILDEI